MKTANALLFLCLLCFLLTGCSKAAPVIVGTPTPAPTATPSPEPRDPTMTGEEPEKDAMGNYILGEDHYTWYISLGEICVYEYENDTFLDAILVNAYPEPLDMDLGVLWYDENEEVLGEGTLHTAAGTHIFPAGSSHVYAEIGTDVDVRLRDFTLEYHRYPKPYKPEGPGALTPVKPDPSQT